MEEIGRPRSVRSARFSLAMALKRQNVHIGEIIPHSREGIMFFHFKKSSRFIPDACEGDYAILFFRCSLVYAFYLNREFKSES